MFCLQDPSYDPYGFAKVATRAASTEGGSAAACVSNVRKFFQTVISMNSTRSGLNQIDQGLKLCSDSQVASTDDVGVLTNYVSFQWVSAVSSSGVYNSHSGLYILHSIGGLAEWCSLIA